MGNGSADTKEGARESGAARRLWQRLARAFSPRRRLLEELRASWGRPGTKDEWLARRYFELTRGAGVAPHVDDRTWDDLEFPRIFATLDTTITRLGSQFLFRQLRTYPDGRQEEAAAYQTSQALRSDRGLREQIQLILAHLRADSCAEIADTLFARPLKNLRYPHLIVLWSLVCIAVLVSVLALSWTWLLILPFFAANVAIFGWIAPREYRLVETLKSCEKLVRVADRLARLGPGVGAQSSAGAHVPQLLELAAARETRRRARRTFRWFALFQMLPFGLDQWLNLLCLAEFLAYIITVNRVVAVGAELRAIYEQVASLDAATAVAGFLERIGTHCSPVLSDEPSIEIQAGRHPLLGRQTANSVTLRNRSALVSGSNMAGKTTFIKMIGINIILGRTLGVCLASRAIIPRAAVRACVRGTQSVESGKSRYFAEAEAMLEFLSSAERGEAAVLLIDEPFSGTNTRERVAAARAVLAALGRRCQVLATTHDVELQELLGDRFEQFHFREDADVEGFFDYRLRPGACTEGNALRLLAKLGFPRPIVEDALAISALRSAR
jgi:hypothetical protein